MNRATRRAMNKKMGEENTENIVDKISQFNKLPESCSACQEPFDKKDKDMVLAWSVVVKQDVVRLFCPECIRKTQEILDERR